MKMGDINHHKPMLTALKKAGFKVVEVVKQDKKTLITVSHGETIRGVRNDRRALRKAE
jgi:F0F1-type ATP synthase epsilon subunit